MATSEEQFLLLEYIIMDKHKQDVGYLQKCPLFLTGDDVKEIHKYAYIAVSLVGCKTTPSDPDTAYLYIKDIKWKTGKQPCLDQYKACIAHRHPKHVCTAFNHNDWSKYSNESGDEDNEYYDPCI